MEFCHLQTTTLLNKIELFIQLFLLLFIFQLNRIEFYDENFKIELINKNHFS
jgi:hypothetical protein